MDGLVQRYAVEPLLLCDADEPRGDLDGFLGCARGREEGLGEDGEGRLFVVCDGEVGDAGEVGGERVEQERAGAEGGGGEVREERLEVREG